MIKITWLSSEQLFDRIILLCSAKLVAFVLVAHAFCYWIGRFDVAMATVSNHHLDSRLIIYLKSFLNFQEMKLRRNAIFFLAFLGSSGRSGFEILLKYRLPKGSNFLAIIVQSISSDLDLQASKSAKRSGKFTEQ